MALSPWAAARVKAVYNRYKMPVWSGLSGSEEAKEIFQRKGIYDVEIAEGEGMLSDHYGR
jgi:Zn-dependent membrane protease YugP